MDGVAVIRHLLVQDAGVLALVPAAADPSRITGDTFGQGVTFPAIRIWKVSGTDLHTQTPAPQRRVSQRIQVEAHAETVPVAKAVLKAVRRACAHKHGFSVGGLEQVVVMTDGEGPSGIDPATAMRVEQQDFRVSFNEEA